MKNYDAIEMDESQQKTPLASRNQSVPIHTSTTTTITNATSRRERCLFLLCTISLVILILDRARLQYYITNANKTTTTTTSSSSDTKPNPPPSSPILPMPHGVNFGSWLSLEDYFFASPHSSIDVATPFGATAGTCLPPHHVNPSTGPRWHSETDLLTNLTSMVGLGRALRAFHAHRMSFYDWESDLAVLERRGVKRVRVPISWCLTDEDPSEIDGEGEEDEEGLKERFTCRDPFYGEEEVLWPAVPRPLIASFLRACAKHSITATLDIHTYPGATSIGTFSGLWPRWSRFWNYDDPTSPTDDAGRILLSDFYEWCLSLADSDPMAFDGLGAITPMNEPAHLAGMYPPGDELSFLPPLEESVARSFLDELNASPRHTTMTNGPHLRVLKWLSDAVTTFRSSGLPDRGVELHVNVIESIFLPDDLPPQEDDEEDDTLRLRLIASWWNAATTTAERSTWAVLDVHHYHAWSPECQGASDGPPAGNYSCGDERGRNETLTRCASWAETYRTVVDEECGGGGGDDEEEEAPPARLASAEFSASTHHLVRHACQDVTTLRETYEMQLDAAIANDVEMFWWSYKMPYGGAFRSAWSFKQFLYLMGEEERPDEGVYECTGDEGVLLGDEPLDDL